MVLYFRPNAVGLVDAYDMHDETVASTLGQYDGNAYQHLFESTQYEPMNQTEVLHRDFSFTLPSSVYLHFDLPVFGVC